MKKLLLSAITILTLVCCCDISVCLGLTQAEAVKLFAHANDEYTVAHKLMSSENAADAVAGFENAAAQYKELLDAGFINGRIYYNLANAHYRLGNAGSAMLYYNKAARLMPRSAELKENMRLIKSEFEDKSVGGKTPGVVKALFFWMFYFSLNEATVFALGFYIAFMICVLLFIFIRIQWLKSLCVGFGVAMIITGSTLGVKIYSEQVKMKGVVVSKECKVRYGPGDEYEPKFLIHEGAEFFVEEVGSKWYKVFVDVEVRQSEGEEDDASKEHRIGWLPKEKVGII